MLKKYKITYLKSDRANAKRYTEEILASSKYNAKQRFYLLHPPYRMHFVGIILCFALCRRNIDFYTWRLSLGGNCFCSTWNFCRGSTYRQFYGIDRVANQLKGGAENEQIQ